MTARIDHDDTETIKRFSLARIIEHGVNALGFIVLVITGLSQKFHAQQWAQWTVDNLGGIDTVRLVHRYTGLLFAALLIGHLAAAVYLVLAHRASPWMVVNKKDFADAIQNLRYYFGFTNNPARCDRYDYKQKFEYWGVVMGGILMATTGFLLWFPVQIYNVVAFLPGQVIPAAKVAHSNEAMLAFLVIAIWHIYNAVFSPEVFPLDTSIFTGRISKHRMMHEHPLEYERMQRENASTKKP